MFGSSRNILMQLLLDFLLVSLRKAELIFPDEEKIAASKFEVKRTYTYKAIM